MHKSSYDGMAKMLEKHLGLYCDKGFARTVIDIGSQDVNGSYKPLFPNWNYIGVDAVFGRNVDKIMVSEFDTGLPDNSADLVISGQCLEHCRNPFKLVAEMYRITSDLCIIVAPFIWKEHRYPVDCWRFLPDGMRCLLEDAEFTVLETCLSGSDCWGVGQK